MKKVNNLLCDTGEKSSSTEVFYRRMNVKFNVILWLAAVAIVANIASFLLG